MKNLYKSLILFYLVPFILSLILTSCGPSINPALQQKISGFWGQNTGKSYKATGNFLKPMPWAVGQWVLTGTTSDDKKSIMKMSIVGKEQGNWIIENYSLTESEESTTQMCISGMERAMESHDVADVDIVSIKTKDQDGNIQTYEGLPLSIVKGMYKKGLTGFDLDISSRVEGAAVTVPAGSFASTYKVGSEVSFLGSKYKSTGWYHTEVPINGMVKAVTEEGDMTIELLDFGMSGAVKSF